MVSPEFCPASSLDSETLGVTVAVQVYVSESSVRRVLNSSILVRVNGPLSSEVTAIRPAVVNLLPFCTVQELLTVTLLIMVDSENRKIEQLKVSTLPAL